MFYFILFFGGAFKLWIYKRIRIFPQLWAHQALLIYYYLIAGDVIIYDLGIYTRFLDSSEPGNSLCQCPFPTVPNPKSIETRTHSTVNNFLRIKILNS